MYQIEEPKYFYLFISIAILVVMYLLVSIWKRKKQREFAQLSLLKKLSPEISKFKSVLKITMVVIGLSFLIFSFCSVDMPMLFASPIRSMNLPYNEILSLHREFCSFQFY